MFDSNGRILGDHAQYYRTALRYLGCIDVNSLMLDVQQQHAFYLGLAALLGEGVYNLGELLAHPVLQTLNATENSWLVDLLCAFNSGDINKFENMKRKWATIADLAAQELFLRQKISLLCLMEVRTSKTRRVGSSCHRRFCVDDVQETVQQQAVDVCGNFGGNQVADQ